MKTSLLSFGVTLACAVAFAQVQSGPVTYRIDGGHSLVSLHVGKAGPFAFAGHEHHIETSAVSGGIQFDAGHISAATVAVLVDATQLKVTGEDEPPADVPEVQRTMLGPKVLDVARFPAISLDGTRITVTSMHGQGTRLTMDVVVSGQFTLHGQHRAVDVPVHVELDGPALTATGSFQLDQSRYGIKPVSVAGMVKVRDTVDVSFTVVARAQLH
jgi:polyisoprenoid-binding protein YceI